MRVNIVVPWSVRIVKSFSKRIKLKVTLMIGIFEFLIRAPKKIPNLKKKSANSFEILNFNKINNEHSYSNKNLLRSKVIELKANSWGKVFANEILKSTKIWSRMT